MGSNMKGTLSKDSKLERSTSNLSLNNMSASQQDTPHTGLRRTISRNSLLDLRAIKADQMSSRAAAPEPPKIQTTAPTEETAATPNEKVNCPPLLRSQSMNSVEMLKQVEPSEGQLAVERISGTVAASPAPVSPALSRTSSSSSMSSSSIRSIHQRPEADHEIPKKLTTSLREQSPNAIASLPSNVDGYHDDFDAKREPNERVDYFSHQWNEDEIADSWRYVINSRQDMANSARLENASWRMWAQAKNHLRTADPSTVNWLKDYDVTWLYGPLYHEQAHQGLPSESAPSKHKPQPEPEQATAVPVELTSATATLPPKSILKKKSLAQIMLEENQDQIDPSQSAANYLRHHLYRPQPQGQSRQVVASILNRQYAQQHQQRNSQKRPPISRNSSSISGKFSRPASLMSMRSSSYQSSNGERKVHFNDRVEQCMAVDPSDPPKGLKGDDDNDKRKKIRGSIGSGFSFGSSDDDDDDDEDEDEDDDDDDEYDDDEDDEDADDDDDDDDDGGLFLGLRRPSTFSTSANSGIITILPATTLKYGEEETQSPKTVVVGAPGSRPSRRPGFNAHYNPHPVQTYEIVDSDLLPVDVQMYNSR